MFAVSRGTASLARASITGWIGMVPAASMIRAISCRGTDAHRRRAIVGPPMHSAVDARYAHWCERPSDSRLNTIKRYR